jgi:hypothetical protein
MIIIRYRMNGLGLHRHVFPDVSTAAECLATVRRCADMALVDVAAKPRVLGALALACLASGTAARV